MVGVDISDLSIKVAEVSDGEWPSLRTVGWQSMDGSSMRRGVVLNVQMVSEALKQALATATVPIEGEIVCASIPETQSFVRVIDVPAMAEDEVGEAVKWAVRQHIPFDPDRVYLDWQLLSTPSSEKRHQQVLVGATRRDVVDPLLEVFDMVGLKVVALELEAQAVVRSLLPQESVDVRGVLLIDIGATTTSVVFFDRGTMRFTSSILQGGDVFTQKLVKKLQLNPEAAAEQKALMGVSQDSSGNQAAGVLHDAVLGLIKDVERVVRQIMLAQESEVQQVKAILLSGGSANLPGIDKVFGEVFQGVPVQLGNPWTNMALPRNKKAMALSKEDMLHFTTAIGCALRKKDIEL